MERLISLFKEADWEQWSPSRSAEPRPPAPRADQSEQSPGLEEPLYFKQLLAYLRERKAEQEQREQRQPTDREDADQLCGV